ncbi:MAG: MFS transporter [Alphaproteobacteria bacterium]|nr:MFS transporter [Alphaproteobacteria bacterium]MCB9931318.1 MFS transporter [Alphaproteobacteria bacterium]
MSTERLRVLFLNLGHFTDHFCMLIFATAVITMAGEFHMSYGALLAVATPGFVLFGAAALGAGWLGDRWSRSHMLVVFFCGTGFAAVVVGMANSVTQIGIGLALLGLFAAIYHPVGIAMLVQGAPKLGLRLGVNGIFGNMGVAFAPLVTGALVAAFDWRMAFIVPGVVAIGLGLAFWWFAGQGYAVVPTGGKTRKEPVGFTFGWQRVLAVVAVMTLVGGLVFNSTTVALPKLFDERLSGIADNLVGFTAMAAVVYAGASFAQLASGMAIDRYAVKPVLLTTVALQVIMMPIVATQTDWPLFAASFVMMLAVFGQIPITDALITRYTPDAVRGRVFSIKYILNLGVGSLAVPSIWYMHEQAGGFHDLFLMLTGCAAVVLVAAAILPYRRHGAEAVAAE